MTEKLWEGLDRVEIWRRGAAYLEYRAPVHVHAVVGFYPLLPEVDRGSRPVGVAVVDRNEDDVLGEDVDLHDRRHMIRD